VKYIEYMKSDAWREKRGLVLERSGGKCEKCGFEACDVHHLTYERLGNESMDDLQALCLKCHWTAHNLPDVDESLPAYAERMHGTEHEAMFGKFMTRILAAGDSQFKQVIRVIA